ncbi:MAG: hypothetical protein Q9M36_02235 [Sulfurovum sp.]|nr:hypothetical protein [Sulfurovum sp.]
MMTYENDLEKIREQYVRESFEKNHNVLLVAHSQGNIIGNQVYTHFTSTQKSKFRMVSVGTPADHVAGVKYADEQHVTAFQDYIIDVPWLPNHLPSNTSGLGHSFISTYMNAFFGGRDKIARLVKMAYNNLTAYTGCSKYDNVYLYVNASNDTVQAVGRIAGTFGTELISEQKVESREIDDECKDYSKIGSYNKLYHFNNDFYSWRIGPFQTQEQVLSHQSAELSYKNYYTKCVDISFKDTLYDVVYKGLEK